MTVKHIEFIVTSPAENLLEVRWLEPLGKVRSSSAYRALQDELEELPGVESLTVGRYSAQMVVAGHVVHVRELAADVCETLENSTALKTALRFEILGASMSVVNACVRDAEDRSRGSMEGRTPTQSL